MQLFLEYVKQRRTEIILFFLFFIIFFISFLLYKLPISAVIYPLCLCVFFGVVILFFDIRRAYKKHARLKVLQRLSADLMDDFPEAETIDDKDYQKIISLLREEQKQQSTKMNMKYSDMVDYYTIWAHQIKTPIASMILTLQNEDSDLSRSVADDLLKIEQYVEMVLMFLRLDSEYTDYVIQEYSIDDIIKGSVKKVAGQFIRRKINLEYRPLNTDVLTDEKWLSFVIEQVLSNALKYTPSGSISIYMEKRKTLCIKDTGIGIASEDLPRIFDKGYTGYNGRSDKKASGIGLYLCKRICKNLGHNISAQSSPDRGTVIRIDLDNQKLEIE